MRGGDEGRRKREGEEGRRREVEEKGEDKRGGYTTYQFMACHCSLKLPVKRAPDFDSVVGCRAGQPLAIWTKLH